MRKIRFLIAFIVFISVATFAADEGPKRMSNFLAVMDLDTGKGVDKGISAPLTNVVIDELVKMKKYKVIDRANRDKILSEMGFQMTGCVDSSCQVEAGRILGVGKMVVGRIDKLGESYVIFLQIIDVQTASIDASARESCKCDEAGLLTTAANTARKLMGRSPGAPSSSKPETARKSTGKCPEDMAYIPEGNFCMDIYEYPNKKGVYPNAKVNLFEARKLCAKIGKRLPTYTEWRQACMGPQGNKYPYGNERRKKYCSYKKLTPSGSFPRCKSAYGVYDMSGNVFELVEGYPKALGGGHIDPLHRWSCNAKTSHSVTNGWADREVGFRCAKDAE